MDGETPNTSDPGCNLGGNGRSGMGITWETGRKEDPSVMKGRKVKQENFLTSSCWSQPGGSEPTAKAAHTADIWIPKSLIIINNVK